MFDVSSLSVDVSAEGMRRHACLGMSPFNSYFTSERILRLVRWARENFEQFHVFMPDGPSAFTLEALGYAPGKARHKARRQGNYLRNKIVGALEEAGVADPYSLVWDSETLESTAQYRSWHDTVQRYYRHDAEFAQACRDASAWVLENKLEPGVVPSEEQTDCAVRYFLAELPLFAAANHVAGVQESAFVYHQRVDFLVRFFAREFELTPAVGQGFFVVSENYEEALVG